jgi:hypothetical protein
MKNLVGTLWVSSSADFQTGVGAYGRGDYATALREFRPLAEQGNAGEDHGGVGFQSVKEAEMIKIMAIALVRNLRGHDYD